MPERTQHAHGTPSWADVQTNDPAQAKEFYGQLFGWEFDDQEIPDSGGAVYSMARRNGREAAAVSSLPEDQAQMGVPPHWNSYVTVNDVDATVAAVPKAGGTVLAPAFDVMDAGRMAVIADSTGAVILPWQAKESIGAQVVNEPGALSWTELMSPDIPKAAEFYKAIFGWESETHEMGPMTYTEFKLDGKSIAGGMKPPMEGMPPVWGVYFAVDDADAAAVKAKELGGAVMQGPMDIPAGRIAVLVDPQGAVFTVIKLAQPGE
jgi:predicted enzyme related to lactoylglutathione lyase